MNLKPLEIWKAIFHMDLIKLHLQNLTLFINCSQWNQNFDWNFKKAVAHEVTEFCADTKKCLPTKRRLRYVMTALSLFIIQAKKCMWFD
jgi:hypothetical protein